MLACKSFIRFGEAHRRKPSLQKGVVVASAPVTIPAKNQRYFKVWQIPLADFFDIARKLSRRAIVFASNGLTSASFGFDFKL